jgi:hypothetical protein
LRKPSGKKPEGSRAIVGTRCRWRRRPTKW